MLFSLLKVSSLHCSINYVNSPFCSVNIILKLRALSETSTNILLLFFALCTKWRQEKKYHWRWIAFANTATVGGRSGEMNDTWLRDRERAKDTFPRRFSHTQLNWQLRSFVQNNFVAFLSSYLIQNKAQRQKFLLAFSLSRFFAAFFFCQVVTLS